MKQNYVVEYLNLFTDSVIKTPEFDTQLQHIFNSCKEDDKVYLSYEGFKRALFLASFKLSAIQLEKMKIKIEI